MRLRPWTETIGPPLLAAVAIVSVVAPAVASPPGSVVAGNSTMRRAPIAEPLPTCRPDLQPAARKPPALDGASWYRLDPLFDASGGLNGQRLVVGRVGRHDEFGMSLAVESFASGPVGGRILVGNDDGQRSIVRLLDVAGYCAAVVHEGRDVTRRAILEPSGRGMVEFRLDRSSRADRGIWSRPFDGSRPRRLLDPLAPNARIGRVFATELSWSSDGKRLIVNSCGESFCLARIFDRSTAQVTTIDDPRIGEVIGLVGDDLVAYGGCPTLPCEVVAMDLRTGGVRDVASLAGLATTSVANGRAVVAFEDFTMDGRLRLVRLDGSGLRTLELGDDLRLVPAPDRALAAIELPAGVVAVAAGSRPSKAGLPATFIDLADGRQLPAPEAIR